MHPRSLRPLRIPLPRLISLGIGLLILLLLITLNPVLIGLPRPATNHLPRPLSALLATSADLVTLTVDLPVISTGWLSGYLGGVESVVIGAATVQLGSDLTQAVFTDINPREKTATLELARPRVMHVSVEPVHQRGGRYGLWTVLPFDCREADAAMQGLRNAKAEAHTAAATPHLIEQASRHAAAVLSDLAAAAGWVLTIHTPGSAPAHGTTAAEEQATEPQAIAE